MCRENFKFIIQLLEMLQFNSGIHKLINTDYLHDSYYKHLRFNLQNQDGNLKLQF